MKLIEAGQKMTVEGTALGHTKKQDYKVEKKTVVSHLAPQQLLRHKMNESVDH